jgi:hypothetical protein
MMLTEIEQSKKVLIVESEFEGIVYAVDRRNDTLWIIDRKAGTQLQIAGDNAYKFADEMLSVADIYLKQRNLEWKVGA